MNLRRRSGDSFVLRASHLDDLVGLGSINAPAARFLDATVRSGLNVLASGGH
jgi:pilus assembly protein CpaF